MVRGEKGLKVGCLTRFRKTNKFCLRCLSFFIPLARSVFKESRKIHAVNETLQYFNCPRRKAGLTRSTHPRPILPERERNIHFTFVEKKIEIISSFYTIFDKKTKYSFFSSFVDPNFVDIFFILRGLCGTLLQGWRSTFVDIFPGEKILEVQIAYFFKNLLFFLRH